MNYNQPSEPSEGGDKALIPAAPPTPALHEPYGLLGYPVGLGDAAAEPTALHLLLECWRILNKRKWLIVSIAATFLVIGAVRTLMQTPLYTANVRLQIDRNVAKIVESGNVTPVEGLDPEFMKTQIELVQSRTMAERVVSALNLGADKDFFEPREFSLIGTIGRLFAPTPEGKNVDKKALQGVAAGIILRNRAVELLAGSRLVDVSYSDPVPARAQRIANAYADAFVASNLDKRFEANASAKTFLEDKIAQLKLRLEESEKKMIDFAQKQQIIEVKEKSSIAESNLASANNALGNLIAERTKNEQQWRQVESTAAINLPQLLSNKVIETLRGKRKELSIEYQQKLETFKPNYPAMVRIKNQIDQIDRELAAEVQAIQDSLKGAYESSLAQEQEMKKRIDTLRQDVLDLQKRSIQYNILKREADTNRELHASLLQRFKEVDIASGVGANNVFVVDRALLPGAPSSPRLMRALLMALALGLVAGGGIAFVLERLDDKIRTVEQVELVAGLSTLGVIPHVGNIEEQLADPRSALAEAYRSLCTALQFSTENGLPKSLTITSAGPSEGKSLTSLAIAKHFASLGRKVLLVDADLRNPSLHHALNCDNAVGLSNYLTGACTPPDAMQKTDVANLAFIASGPLPPNAADLLGSPRVLSLLSIGSEVFDLIVIDGPPVLGLADAQLLSSSAAATVFIVAAGTTRTGNVRGALRRLQLSRGTLIGTVLTKYDAKAAAYGYGYGYGSGYGYGYGDGYEYAYGAKPKEASRKPNRQPVLQDLRDRLTNMRESA
jgi:succinoglycan biosynthesis transport protein ExoP